MYFLDLRRTLKDAVETGKIGTPVALRVFVQSADPPPEPAAVCAAGLDLAAAVFSAQPSTLIAQGDDRHGSVLISYTAGQTLSLSFAAAASSNLHLLLVGNRGVARLEGGELFDDVFSGDDVQIRNCRRWIETSLREEAPVVIGPGAGN